MDLLGDDLLDGAKGVEVHSKGKINQRQVYRMVETGFLPVIRVGRRMYFRASEVEAAFRSANG